MNTVIVMLSIFTLYNFVGFCVTQTDRYNREVVPPLSWVSFTLVLNLIVLSMALCLGIGKYYL